MKTAALILTALWSTAVAAQAQKPTTGYAPVNGLKMYYEIHSYENLADDIAGLLDYLKIKQADLLGYSMRPRSKSRLAVLPTTTHITLMEKGNAIIPMVNAFLDAKAQNNRK